MDIVGDKLDGPAVAGRCQRSLKQVLSADACRQHAQAKQRKSRYNRQRPGWPSSRQQLKHAWLFPRNTLANPRAADHTNGLSPVKAESVGANGMNL